MGNNKFKVTTLINNIGQLATPLGFQAKKGKEIGKLKIIENACIAINLDTIVWVGSCNDLPDIDGNLYEHIDVQGRAVIPGFVDSHTHFVFSGSRVDEFVWRASGIPYMEIHKRGGGIANSVKATREAPEPILFELGLKRLNAMLEQGITTVESKSGYGLDLDTELKQLRVMKSLAEHHPVTIVPTYMGAHSVPKEYTSASAYIDYIIANVFPEVKKQGIAKIADIFCEKGVFELEDTKRYLEAARDSGFSLKLHADEIHELGGTGLGVEYQALSVDHLLKASQTDIAKLAGSNTVGTLLPLTAFVLKEPFAPGRAMIDAGCAVALGSDHNPGSCYSQSIPLVIALAVLYMGLSMEETLTALTLNGAAACGLADTYGSIEPGKKADFIVLDAPDYRYLAYNTGMNLVHTVYKHGLVVHKR